MSSDESCLESVLPVCLMGAANKYWNLIEDTVNKEQNILAKNQKKDELESMFAAELKLNAELKEKLQQINKNSSHYDSLCRKFSDSLTLKDSDQTRLHNAQEMLKIMKEYTGIRWDYTAPPNVIKGYVKNSSKMMLDCFEYDQDKSKTSAVVANLWKYVASAASVDWQDLVTGKLTDKENVKSN